jgi:hypothetical protein
MDNFQEEYNVNASDIVATERLREVITNQFSAAEDLQGTTTRLCFLAFK